MVYQYNKKRFDIHPKEIQNYVAEATEKWVDWERDTKKLLQERYSDLVEIGEIASAQFIAEFIKDVDKELAFAESEWLLTDCTGYDMSYIVEMQEKLKNEYGNKKVRVSNG